MTTGSLAASPWHFRKNYRPIEPSSIQDAGPPSSSRLPLRSAVRRRPRPKNIQEESPERAGSTKPATRRPTPRSRPPSAGGPDRALKICTHITAMRRGVATVKPATPESRNAHGHSASYGAAITRPTRHCCHVDHDVTHGELSVRPVGGGPPQSGRRLKAARPLPVGPRYGRLPIAG